MARSRMATERNRSPKSPPTDKAGTKKDQPNTWILQATENHFDNK